MKKVFFGLLFLSIAGAGVLVWLIRAAPSSPKPAPEAPGLTIIDEKHEEAGKAAAHAADGDEEEEEKGAASASKGEGEHEPAGDKAEGKGHADPASAAKEGAAGEADHEPDVGPHGAEGKRADSKHELISVLTVRTEPPGARVRIDGELRGHTPYELALTEKEQKVEVEAEGFEPFTRTAPPAKEAGNGQLGWKVQLKSKPESKPAAKTAQAPHGAAPKKAPAPEAKPAVAVPAQAAVKQAVVPPPSSKETLHVGRLGPYVIQFKSIERTAGSEAAVKEAVAKLRAELASITVGDVIVGCAVDLGAKGRWVRLVAGPFTNKQAAASRLAHYKNVVGDAYVAGVQRCQP